MMPDVFLSFTPGRNYFILSRLLWSDTKPLAKEWRKSAITIYHCITISKKVHRLTDNTMFFQCHCNGKGNLSGQCLIFSRYGRERKF